MEDFIVKKADGEEGTWYMHIGFKEIRVNDEPMVNCSGSAVICPDDETEYTFSYSFRHSLDWREVTAISLKPVKSYKITMEQVNKIATDIFYNIKEFISRMN